MQPTFYFTTHPNDMIRTRIIPGSHIMLVAAASWDDERKRFKIRRPPADHITSIAIDSGGFTAAQKWGKYPWTPQQYTDFIRETARDVTLDFCAVMDYACEREVNRITYHTNRQRIKATIRNETALKALAPDLPWLPVLQGNTIEERSIDINLRAKIGLLPTTFAGIGSICGRTPSQAQQAIRFYTQHLPGVKFHPFGIHIQALDADDVYWLIKSWDTYSWNWPRGAKNLDRPPEYRHQEGETWSSYTYRLAKLYWQNTILPRIEQPRQHILPI